MVNSVTEHLKPFQWKEQYEHGETECGGKNQEVVQTREEGYGVDDLVGADMKTPSEPPAPSTGGAGVAATHKSACPGSAATCTASRLETTGHSTFLTSTQQNGKLAGT